MVSQMDGLQRAHIRQDDCLQMWLFDKLGMKNCHRFG